MHIRLANLNDAEAVRSIYNLEVETAPVTFDLVPRSLEEQREWIAARAGAHAVLVAVEDEEIVGFAALSPYRSKPAYSTSVENSVYVHRDHQGKGIGDVLLGALVEAADQRGFHATFARIVGGHERSLSLHRKHGFHVVGVEREVGRKFGRWLDVVLMERLAGGAPIPPFESRPYV